jgi:hypothetical protein
MIPLEVRVVDPEAHGVQRRRLVTFVELDSEIVAVNSEFRIIERGCEEIPGPRHMRLRDEDPIEAVTAAPDQRDTKAMPGLGHKTVLPRRVTVLEDDVHGFSRLSPLVIDRKAGDSPS